MIRQELLVLALVSPFGLLACSNDGSVDLGRNLGGQLSDYVATWDGYTEAFRFDPDSDRIRLTIDGSGQGILLVGDQPPPPPLDLYDPQVSSLTQLSSHSMLPGFAYPIRNTHVEAERIQFEVNANDWFRQWCEAQTPFCDSSNGYCACVHNWPIECRSEPCTQQDPVTAEVTTVPLGRIYMCTTGLCSCEATACLGQEQIFPFDAALENGGTKLVGSFGGIVRMTRQ